MPTPVIIAGQQFLVEQQDDHIPCHIVVHVGHELAGDAGPHRPEELDQRDSHVLVAHQR